MLGNDSFTKLLLHMNGANGSTTFIDDSDSLHAVSAVGNAQVSTAQSKFGGASGLFGGTGDSLSLPDSADWDLGAGDFTVDTWLMFTNMPTSNIYIQYVDANNYIKVYFDGGYPGFFFEVKSAGSLIAQHATFFFPNVATWYHFALVRSGTTIMMFINGSSQSVDNFVPIGSSTLPNLAASLGVGNDFDGYFDEFRLSKGIARWTSNFTTAVDEYSKPFDPNTKLLLHMNGANGSTTFIDDSDWTHTVTAVGNTQVSTTQSKFGGASGLLDGTGDYLTIPDSADFDFGTGDWSVDFWVYPNAFSSNAGIFTTGTGTVNNGGFTIAFGNTGTFNTINIWQPTYNTVLLSGSTPIPLAEWTHVAVAKDSTSLRLYVNGVLDTDRLTSNSFDASPSQPTIVGRFATDSDALYFNGYVDELRVTKGLARWVYDFTLPVAAYDKLRRVDTEKSYVRSTSVAVGNTLTDLLSGVASGNTVITTLQLGNIDGSNDATVSLYVNKKGDHDTMFLNNLVVPVGKSVVVFSDSSGKLTLQGTATPDTLKAVADAAGKVTALINYVDRI